MEVGSHVCSSVLSNGFSHKEYRPLRLRSCFCPFVICEVRILLPGGWGEGSGWVSASGASFVWWWWFAGCCYPLYYSSAPDPELSFNVYQPPGLIADSDPPVCSEVLSPDPLLLSHLLGLQWAQDCVCGSHLCPSACHISSDGSNMPTFRCFNVKISQTCLCVEWGLLCWIIAIRLVVTSRGEN